MSDVVMTLPDLADHYWAARVDRLLADKLAAALKTKESAAEAELIRRMQEEGLTAVGGKLVRLSLPTVPDYIPTVNDWEKLWAHILATKDFSFLHKRVTVAAVKERWAEDIEVPGVVRFPVWKLSKSEVKN